MECLAIYRSANREDESERETVYRAQNKEAIAARNAAFRAANKEAEAARKAEWYAANIERLAAYRAANKETIAARNMAYRASNQDKVSALKRIRRARKRGVPGRHTAKEAAALLTAQGHICASPQCGASLRLVPKHLDHITPLSRLELNPTNSIENLQWLCQPCNNSKGAKTMGEWLRL